MLRIRVLSDLHFEFHRDEGAEFVHGLDNRGVDLLVLAGDITKMRIGFHKTLKRFRDRFNCPIVYVHGNHEFHESNRETVLRAMKDAMGRLIGVDWLDNRVLTVRTEAKAPTYRVLGTPLWFDREPPPKNPFLLSTEEEWAHGIIREADEKGVTKSRPYADFEAIENFHEWVYEENAKAVQFLKDNMREGDIVVTHFLPTQQSVHRKFGASLNNCWFVHDIEPLIVERKPALWIHGHTHESMDYRIGSTRVVCNPFGYVTEGELNESFDENFTVEV
jgi:Icc-related predicted phosphoesterase